jgi:hypothetical protein
MTDHTQQHNAVLRCIRDYLAAIGAYELKVLGGVGQRAGVPDLLACLTGRFLAVEVKTGRAALNMHQQRERARIERAGGLYILAHAVDDVERSLVQAGLATPCLA